MQLGLSLLNRTGPRFLCIKPGIWNEQRVQKDYYLAYSREQLLAGLLVTVLTAFYIY